LFWLAEVEAVEAVAQEELAMEDVAVLEDQLPIRSCRVLLL
jgi:hypothetical protein